MKASVLKLSLQKIMLISIILTNFIALLIGIGIPNRVYGWGSENYPGNTGSTPPYSAHYFIINKAIEHLRNQNLLPATPLENYASHINHGAYFADFPYEPFGLVCIWGEYTDLRQEVTCEAIHHFYSSDCIRLTNTEPNLCTADTGGLAVPQYAETLFDLAVRFWPGGVLPPAIHDLQYLPSGGHIITPFIFDGESLGPFVVGALPFAAAAKAQKYNYPFFVIEDAYTWPGFTDGSESVTAALTYLGWAIHLVTDVCTPVHALNETGTEHESFEFTADQLISEPKMSHLPVDPAEQYYYAYNIDRDRFYSTRGNFFNNWWNIAQFAQECHDLAIQAANIPLPSGDILRYRDAEIEADLDAAIKIAAGLIYKFFSQVELPQDSLEPNDTPQSASTVQTGVYDNLTIHAPNDEDYFQFIVNDNSSDIQIVMEYDALKHDDATFYIEYEVCQGGNCSWVQEFAKSTPTGRIYEAKYAPAGRKYRFHVYGMDDLPLTYKIRVYIGAGDLPPDPYESNDTPNTAHALSAGMLTDTNIHSYLDVDYYTINASGYSVKAEITFDPSRGNLELFADDVQATSYTVSGDGNQKTLRITKCGGSPSIVKVEGQRNFYKIYLSKVLLEEGCPGYNPLVPLKGTGNFVYTPPQYTPGSLPPEETATLREQMQAHKTSETSDTVLWSIGAYLDLPGGFYFPLVLEASCPKTSGSSTVNMVAKILSQNLNYIEWSGSGQGTCFGTENSGVITGVSTVINNMTSVCGVGCGYPGHGTLTVDGNFQGSPVAEAGGPYSGTQGSAVTFEASHSSDSNGTIVLYEWDWNSDGIYEESIRSAHINHVFDSPYNGFVRLRTTDNEGLTATDITSVDIKSLLYRVLGSAFFYPENPSYRGTFSMDATGPTPASGWIKYYYSGTRMNFVSTGITSVSFSGNISMVSGIGTVNGVSGYAFTATVTSGVPDTFEIRINKPDGVLYYSAGPRSISGGDLAIKQQ